MQPDAYPYLSRARALAYAAGAAAALARALCKMGASAELLRRVVCAVLLVAGCLGLAALVLETALEKSAALPLREAADLEARVAKATADSGTEPGDEDASCTATYRLVLGLMVDESARGPVDWDVEAAVARHLGTFLADVSALARFEIDTQVLYFSRLARGATTDRIPVRDLEAFMSANDWNASPLQDSARERVIHLMAHLPDKASTHIQDERGDLVTAFYVPRWGGVSILPLAANETQRVSAEMLQPTMAIFEQFIRAALHLDHTPGAKITRRERARRAKTYIVSATQTLAALGDLVQGSGHMTIVERVAIDFREALAASQRALNVCDFESKTQAQTNGTVSDVCLRNTRDAFVLAEKAFFDPSLLPQLYFPPEHWFAVFMPFTIPAVLPLLGGSARILAALIKKKN